MSRRLIAAVIAALAAAALAWGWMIARDSRALALGRTTYAQYCAACHGPNLEGQPNWKEPLPSGRMPAPPHDAAGHTWHHSDQELFTITKKGLGAVVPGYESDMPAFESTLTDEEIRAVLAYIRSSWPEQERELQAARSRLEPPAKPSP